MKKDVVCNKLLFSCVLFVFLGLSGCGLDSYYYLDPPRSVHAPSYSASDPLQKYFSFLTTETASASAINASYFDSSSEFSFQGTEVLYKIYNNYSTMLSVESTVSSKNSSSTDYSAAAEYLTETAGYKKLRISRGSYDPFVPAGSSPENRYVYIRLTDYSDSEDYKAAICIGNTALTEYDESYALTYGGTVVYPRRYGGSNYTFNFGGDDTDYDKVPSKSDSDVTWSSTTSSDGVWYVDMYAVSVGLDTTYTRSYSKVLFLGSVSITEGEEN